MKQIATLLVIAILTTSFETNPKELPNESDWESIFQEFLIKYNKSYASFQMYDSRFNIFKTNYQNMVSHNTSETSYTKGINQFADMTSTEFRQYYNGTINTDTKFINRPNEHEDLLSTTPTSLDWRKTAGVLTAVKNQEQCGSCWAFSAIETLESRWQLKGNALTIMSEEELVQCDTNGDQGCQGGLMQNAYGWMAKGNGIVTEAAYPYTSGGGTTGSCSLNSSMKPVENNVSGSKMISKSVSALMNELVLGPVAIAVDAQEIWQSYTGGVMKAADCGTSLDHGVQVVGYTETTWIVRNSWGASWGLNGYCELEKADGVNTCGILSNAVVPVLSDTPLPPAPPTPQDSCKGHCGEVTKVGSCQCSSFLCMLFKCCADFDKQCGGLRVENE